MEKAFGRRKKQCLDRLDASKKGSVDAGAVRVVSLLNGFENYCTTSSCSGRIVLVDGVPESRGVQKQNCVWLFVSHQKCQAQDLVSALAGSTGDAALKFEPFVLHVQCRRLQDAQLVHSVAVNSGFRNSGLTVSKAGKIVAAVRSTHGLEVPLSQRGKLLVGQDYIHVLVRVANQKMEENLKRIHRFYTNLQSALTAGQLQELQIRESSPTPEAETDEDAAKDGDGRKVYRRRRKRERRQTDCRHGNTDSGQPELEDCLDLFAGGAVGVEPAN